MKQHVLWLSIMALLFMISPLLDASKCALAQSYDDEPCPTEPDGPEECDGDGSTHSGDEIPQLRASISASASSACAGTSISFSANAYGGIKPYSYEWYEGYDGVSYNSVGSRSSYSTTMPPDLDLYIKLKVTSKHQTASSFRSVTNIDGSPYCSGSYKAELDEKIAAEQGQLSEMFVPSEAYPNPFNPSTVIAYDLPESADVVLAVYDVMGREVARLIDGYREAGYHRVAFDASNLPSGVYLYRLRTGSFVVSKQITFLK